MEDDPTGNDAAFMVNKNWWDVSVTTAPGINAGPANKRTYKLARGTVKSYFDYLKKHGISYSVPFVKKKKKFKWTYPKDRINPDNLKILG